jgi:hypothetical protein
MERYKYSFTTKLIYRYGNIPLTVFLFIFLISSLLQIPGRWYALFAVLIDFALIFTLNKYYFATYRSFPSEISADNERIVCSGFLLNRKKIEIKLSDIDNISGGIFRGVAARPVYIHDSRQNITIGFYQQVNNFRRLLAIILRNIPDELYGRLLEEMKERSI